LGGGGGAGGNEQVGAGGKGGSGVVIISYLGAQQFGGGNVTSVGGNTIHTFTTSGTLSPPSPLTAQYLVVGGGGGGGTGVGVGGGGGAGGYRTGTGLVIDANSNYVITVGAGGASTVSGSSSAFLATTSAGGGAGGISGNGSAGGSGGGGSAVNNSVVYTGGAGNTPSTSPSQGNTGGSGQGVNGAYEAGGGGGGASAVGANSVTSVSGAGGAGTANSISGTSVTYAGGGGGGGAIAGAGGAGGGGAGGGASGQSGTAGTANTGGGGGGANNTATAAAGGSGVVIIAYPGSTQQMAGGTVTISGGNVIHTFTSSGYLTPIKYASRSLRFRSSASAYLNRTPPTAGNTKTFTYSAWVKRGSLSSLQNLISSVQSGNSDSLRFTAADQLEYIWSDTSSGQVTTTQLFRDPSAWYHIVYAMDTTQATAANRFKLYVNGVQVTAFATSSYPAQNTIVNNTGAVATKLGQYANNSTQSFDGYMAEVNLIDGAALTPSSFGTVNSFGVWQPITYGGSYGTNGFYLTFGNNTSTTTLGYDTSPQGNNWTTNNISLTTGTTYDSMTDVPTLTSATVANYATWNPLRKDNNTSISLASGNLAASGTNYPSGAFMSTIASQGSGLWYAEITFSNLTYPTIGVADITVANICPSGSMNVSGVVAWDNNSYFINGSSSSSGATFASGDVLGIAFDGSTRKVWFAKNNTWISSGNPAAGTNQIGIVAGTGPLAFACRPENSVVIYANFGQQGFTYTPPSGFVALNTYNLSTPTIPNGATQFAATTYTGTGAALTVANTVNGTSFQPDFVWGKSRSAVGSHTLTDSVRGVNSQLFANATAAQNTNTDNLTAFNSNGFSFGTSSNYNGSGTTFVAWNWKANGTGVSNTSGSITSTVSANTTAGFSIATFSGASGGTVGHGLGVAPQMIIIKSSTTATGWYVYTSTIGPNGWLVLETTAAAVTGNSAAFGGTPTSTVWTYGAGLAGTGNYVAYAFTPIAGFSAFGSYTGNGSTDGPFVYTGFRPRFVLVKNSSAAGKWVMMDTSRGLYNEMTGTNALYPNTNETEGTDSANRQMDFLSNGFKLRCTGGDANGSGNTIIYMAFAENPFKYSNAR
jgi:hypothetical protein